MAVHRLPGQRRQQEPESEKSLPESPALSKIPASTNRFRERNSTSNSSPSGSTQYHSRVYLADAGLTTNAVRLGYQFFLLLPDEPELPPDEPELRPDDPEFLFEELLFDEFLFEEFLFEELLDDGFLLDDFLIVDLFVEDFLVVVFLVVVFLVVVFLVVVFLVVVFLVGALFCRVR